MDKKKRCPKCDYWMILERRDNRMLTSEPPKFPMMWWCGCGYMEDAGYVEGRRAADLRRERWKQVNCVG